MKKYMYDQFVKMLYYGQLLLSKIKKDQSIKILTFHRVLPKQLINEYPIPNIAVTPEEFKWVLCSISRHYICGSLKQTLERWSINKKFKYPLLAITFDDGQKDNIRYALPILKELQMNATFFLPVSNIENSDPLWHDILGFTVLKFFEEKPSELEIFNNIFEVDLLSCKNKFQAAKLSIICAKNLPYGLFKKLQNMLKNNYGILVPDWSSMMNWEQVKLLIENNHEIGCHSMTHPILTKCSDDELFEEIVQSRNVLQKKLNINIESFCFPNGNYDENSLKMVKRAGYKCSVTTKWKNNIKDKDLFELGRCDIVSERLKTRSKKELSFPWLMWRLNKLKTNYENLRAKTK